MISAYEKHGVKIVKEQQTEPRLDFDLPSGKIVLTFKKIAATTKGTTPNDLISFVRDTVNRHELFI